MRIITTFIPIIVFSIILNAQIPKSAYVVNTLGESMSIIDLQNQIVLQPPKPLGLFPNDIQIMNERAFVINSGINEIRIFDLSMQASLGGIDVGNGTNPYRMAFVNDSVAAVSMWLVDSVYFVNVNSRQIIQRVIVGTSPEGIISHQGKVFVANSGYTAAGYQNGTISVIDLNNYAVTDIPVNMNPQSLAIDSQGNLIVACSGDYQSIGSHMEIVDISQGAVIFSQSINIPLLESLWKIAINTNDMVYMGTYGSGVMVFDVSQRIFVRDENNPLNGGPSMAFDNQDNVYISNFSNDTVHVYTPDHQLIHSYLVGDGPISIAVYDPSPTSITSAQDRIPVGFRLYQNFPNPFNPSTEIQFYLESPTRIQLRIYNINGQLVSFLIDGTVAAGTHRVNWDGRDRQNRRLPSGTYFYQLKTEKNETVKRMILLK